jgi:hypothetical protein
MVTGVRPCPFLPEFEDPLARPRYTGLATFMRTPYREDPQGATSTKVNGNGWPSAAGAARPNQENDAECRWPEFRAPARGTKKAAPPAAMTKVL